MSKLFGFGLLTLGLLAVSAYGQQCNAPVRLVQQKKNVQQQKRQQAVVQVVQQLAQPVLVAEFVSVPVPAYSVGYGHQPNDAGLLQLELQKLRLEIQALRVGVQVKDQSGLKVIQTRCASCHEQATAKTKGGGFALLSGESLLPLTDRQALNVSREVYSGRMPKGGKLSDAEVADIMSLLDSIK